MEEKAWKVGELAREARLSVRTLHHYDEIGLLVPSRRTESGHRLYVVADVARLQQIKSLRGLGFSLNEVREALDRPGHSPRGVIARHVEQLSEQIEVQQRLRSRLEAIAKRLGEDREVPVEELFRAIEETEMTERFEKYYTKEQLEELAERREVVGEERIRQAETEWNQLIAAVRVEMERGTDPESARVQTLARQWQGLINEFTGGNPEIEESLRRMYRDDPNIATDKGYRPDPNMAHYVGKSLESRQE